MGKTIHPATEHFLRRCRERWGFVPSIDECDAMCVAIRAGVAVAGTHWAGGRRSYYVPVRGYARLVMFEPRDGTLITALGSPLVPWERMRTQLLAEGA